MSNKRPIIPPDTPSLGTAVDTVEGVYTGLSVFDRLFTQQTGVHIIKSNDMGLLERCYRIIYKNQAAVAVSVLHVHATSMQCSEFNSDYGTVQHVSVNQFQPSQSEQIKLILIAAIENSENHKGISQIIEEALRQNLPCILIGNSDIAEAVKKHVSVYSIINLVHINGVHAIVEKHPSANRHCVAVPQLLSRDDSPKEDKEPIIQHGVTTPYPVVPTILSVHYRSRSTKQT